VSSTISAEQQFHGTLIGIRVIVFDHDEARRLYALGFYGKPLGVAKPRGSDFDAPLELGLVEAVYLAEKGLLVVEDIWGRKLGVDDIKRYAASVLEGFDLVYTVYRDLRDKGYVVRSGLKFGAAFAVYEKGPGLEHAPYLVHVVPYNERIEPLEIVRAGRLSHSVRKYFVIALVESPGSEVKYMAFEWSKL